MTRRTVSWLVWSLLGLYVLAVAGTLGLVAAGNGNSDDVLVVFALGYAVVGAMVTRREPANAVGWLLLVIAVTHGLSNLSYAYARHPGQPGGIAAAWFADWAWIPWAYGTTMLLPLLFPTGRTLSPKWRSAVAVVLTALVLSIIGAGLRDGSLDVESPAPIPNPLGVSGPLATVVQGAAVLGGILGFGGLLLGVLSIVLRLRRSRGRERHQLKLFVFVVMALLLDLSVFLAGGFLGGPSAPSWVQSLNDLAWLPLVFLVTLGLPFAIGFAILRHDLYGIDVVINRTLVYGALTVTLAASYLGLVLVFRTVVSPVTGESDLAVAGSTLAVAALFRPLRSRIQLVVDHRFYRSRYDAARTLETFSTHLRDELDLDAMGTDLRSVVADTMQPAHVSLWLRGAAR